MKKFFAIYSNKAQKSPPDELEKDHVSFLQEIEKKKKLVVYRSLVENDHAILIFKEVSREKALDIIYRDPFIQTKYYRNFKLSTIEKVDGEEKVLISSQSQ